MAENKKKFNNRKKLENHESLGQINLQEISRKKSNKLNMTILNVNLVSPSKLNKKKQVFSSDSKERH